MQNTALGNGILHGDGVTDDTAAIRTLLAGRKVLDQRIELEIGAPLPPGLYAVRIPTAWPLATPETLGRIEPFVRDRWQAWGDLGMA